MKEKGAIAEEKVGSARYQNDHMDMIFGDGLSFSGFERNKVFVGSGGGSFSDLSAVSGADSDLDCRAACVGDFDQDGDPDLFVTSIQRDGHLLYRNDLDRGDRALIVELRATTGHASATGAIVRVAADRRLQAQVMSCGSGFESQHEAALFFSFGAADRAKLEVFWPGGRRENFEIARSAEGPTRVLLIEGQSKPIARILAASRLPDPRPVGLRIPLGATLPELQGRDRADAILALSPRHESGSLIAL